MAGQQASARPDNKLREKGERESITEVMRDFQGVNLQSPRESIDNNEFGWLEGLIPVGPGNLSLVPGPGASIVTVAETGPPSYTEQFQVGSTAYVFAVWKNSGHAWIGPALTSVGWAQIATGFTSGQTAAIQWSNLGLLIVDPVKGYYDWNITTAATLTALSGTVMNLTMPQPLSGVTPSLYRIIDATGPGAGATFGFSLTVVSATLGAAGAGYVPGDILTIVGGTLTTATQAPAADRNQPTLLRVVTVGGGGAVATYTILNGGFYQAMPANPAAVTGGAGAGATFTLNTQSADPFIITAGSGYVTPTVQVFRGGLWVGTFDFLIQGSGSLLGTAIAVYAGRVWIAINRTVQFTDAASYNSFGNSGSAFTINDSYLINQITGLFAANNYLYIFGDTSVDVLSNVTVDASGIVVFSRINASASIGTNAQFNSIFAFSRAIAFANANGFYLMSGATPQKISDKLDGLFPQIDFGDAGDKLYGAQVMIGNVLCPVFMFTFYDTFTDPGTTTERAILALEYRGKWFFVGQIRSGTSLNLQGMVSIPVNGVQNLYGWSGPALYPLMSDATAGYFLFKTKLWDGGEPIDDKQTINCGLGVDLNGAPTPGVSVMLDNEFDSVSTTLGVTFSPVQWINNAGQVVQWTNSGGVAVTWTNNVTGYAFLKGSANAGGGKYVGLTVSGQVNISRVRAVMLEFTNTRRW